VAVGCPAHLGSLRRTRIGRWLVEDAWTLDGLSQAAADEGIESCMLNAAELGLEFKVNV